MTPEALRAFPLKGGRTRWPGKASSKGALMGGPPSGGNGM